MGLTLVARSADPQALKALIAAKLSTTAVTFTPTSDAASGPFGISRVQLQGDGNVQLSEANAIAEFLAGAPAALEVKSWLEWEEASLRPAVYTGNTSACLDLLDASLKGDYVAGSSTTVADACLFSTLLPLAQASKLPAKVAAYHQRLAELPAFKEALQQVLGDQPASALAAVQQADAAAFMQAKPKLPIKGQRNILITSALPYVNNVPHLGNIIGCVLSADCYARFCRARGHNCIYVCGTDEYGTATETKALEEGLTCAQICDKYHAIHAGIYQWFDISFDKFGRTPSRWQTHICQSIFSELEQAGQLVEQSMEQLYSEALGKFLADRFVTGTCPKCGYIDARGDQCDGCGNLLNPTELINPKCKVTGTTPVVRSTRHIFLDLPQLSPKLQEYISTTSQMGGWSSNCVQVTNAWMRDGLKNRCITRDLRWGTPVPRPGYEDKVFYVWFDAPIGYISITANYTNDWQQWWQNPEEVEMVQFMGKDNVPFHTVIFPATLLGTGQRWTMMRNISVTEYLNYEGGKFSKSRGTGVFGNDAQSTGIPSDVWRYYLLSNRPEQSDTDFKWDDLAAKNNNELLANLGNFINRALKFVVAFFGGQVPAATAAGADVAAELGGVLTARLGEYVEALEKIRIKDGIRIAMAVSAAGNKFFQDNKLGGSLAREDPERCATIVAAGVGVVRLLAALIQPYMPASSAKILAMMSLPASAAQLSDELLAAAAAPQALVAAGTPLGTVEHLFKTISEDTIAELRGRFGGSQADRQSAASSSTAAAAKGKPAAAVKGKQPAAADGKKASDGAAAASSSKAEKGEKAAKGGGGGGGNSKKEERPVDISLLDIRVALIKKAWKHPDAESLYVEEVDVGEGAPRQVVSGLVKHIPEAEMQNRRVLVVANMKPANMRGVQSQAMVLAATSADGSTVELVEPPAAAAVGERVVVAGYEGEPEAVLNPKKKVFEAVAAELGTDGERRACYRGLVLSTSAGACGVRSVAGGTIK